MQPNPVRFPQVSNRETWDPTIGIVDDTTGSPVDLTGITFQLEIRRIGPRSHGSGNAYGNFNQYGSYENEGPVISASLNDGLTVVDVGVVQVNIPESKMRTLQEGTYSVAMTANDGDVQRQLFIGHLPVIFGGVTS